MKQILSALMALIGVAGLVLVFLPGVLWWRSGEPFPWRDGLTLLFTAITVEKFWSSLVRMRRYSTKVHGDWTAVTVGVSYAAVLYGTLIEFYATRGAGVEPLWVVLGAGTYAGAVALRYWALHHLGNQWVVHLDEAPEDGKLVVTGPYGLVRHPIYLGACLEVVGLPVLFGAWWALLLAVAAFIPFEVQRAYFEERLNRRTFGAAYDSYARRTWGFVPLWRKQP